MLRSIFALQNRTRFDMPTQEFSERLRRASRLVGLAVARSAIHLLVGAATGLVALADVHAANKTRARNAATCTFKDLSVTMGPVRDQGDVGWCYANTAADLLGAKLKMQQNEPLSAVFLAFQYNYHNSGRMLPEGGYVGRALEKALIPKWKLNSELEALASGMCPKSIEDEALDATSGESLKEKVKTLEKIKSIYDRSKHHPDLREKLDAILDDFRRSGNIVGTMSRASLNSALEKGDARTFPLYFADALCSNKRFYNTNAVLTPINHSRDVTWLFELKGKTPKEVVVQEDLTRDIDFELDRNNVVGINYYVDFVRNGKLPHTTSEFHASVVVGRRWHNNSCQYLIRNSWGPECTKTDEQGRKVPRHSKLVAECSRGNLWIDEKHLRAVTDSVDFFMLI